MASHPSHPSHPSHRRAHGIASLASVYTLSMLLAGCSAPTYDGTHLHGWDAIFDRTDGWTGADAAYSVELGPGRSLFLFGDTWIGPVRDGRHVDATMVNNTVAVLDHGDADPPSPAAARFAWGPNDAAGKATAWLTPDPQVFRDAEGSWFWPGAGVRLPDAGLLAFFVARLKRRGDDSVFDFRPVDSGIVLVDDPDAPLDEWRPRQIRLPFAHPERQVTWGVGMAVDGGRVWVYGIDDRDPQAKALLIAQVGAVDIGAPAAWRFRNSDGIWSAEPAAAAPIAHDIANELSVHREGERWVMLYSENGFSDRVLLRDAPAPDGPWSRPRTVYRVPDLDADAQHFTYAAKAHPQLSRDGLIFSYVVNSLDFFTMAGDARIYRPRFVRLPADEIPGR